MAFVSAKGGWLLALLLWLPAAAAGAQGRAVWTEAFSDGPLNPSRWQVTSSGDARTREAQVVESPPGSAQFRLALSADTRGTPGETVMTVGVRSVARLSLVPDARVSFDVDWNDPENGSYLSGAAVLAPGDTSGDVLALADWLKVEYVGVPPGQLARMVIAVKAGGHERTLFAEGWPERNRVGRRIRRPHLVVLVRNGYVEVRENDAIVYASTEPVVGFSTGHLYFRLSSHSNYPRRTILFGPVRAEGTGLGVSGPHN